MRIFLLLALLAISVAAAQEAAGPEPPWMPQLAEEPRALAAVEQFQAMLVEGRLGELAKHFSSGRLRLNLIEQDLPDGLYGSAQARSLLGAWLEPLDGRPPRISRVSLSEDGTRLGLLLWWPPESREEPLPVRQLICELGLDAPVWTFESATSP